MSLGQLLSDQFEDEYLGKKIYVHWTALKGTLLLWVGEQPTKGDFSLSVPSGAQKSLSDEVSQTEFSASFSSKLAKRTGWIVTVSSSVRDTDGQWQPWIEKRIVNNVVERIQEANKQCTARLQVLVLAAGYGTRLEKDILESTKPEHAVLRGVPKPLLPVGGSPLITYWMKSFAGLPEGTSLSCTVVVNGAHERLFQSWLKDSIAKNVPGVQRTTLVCDGTNKNEDRLGSIGDFALALSRMGVHEVIDSNGISNAIAVKDEWRGPCIVAAGDTLFLKDFQLHRVWDTVQSFVHDKDALVVTWYKLSADKESDVSKRGILELAPSQNEGQVDDFQRVCVRKVERFLEKPSREQTNSRCACPPLYILSSSACRQVFRFLREHQSAPLEARDAPGKLVAWLSQQQFPVYAYGPLSGRFDVGNLTDFEDADRYFLDHNNLNM